VSRKNFVRKKSEIMMKMLETTTTHVVDPPTPWVPASVFRPFQQDAREMKTAKTAVLAIPVERSISFRVSTVLAQ
jgi:hypothetical protein